MFLVLSLLYVLCTVKLKSLITWTQVFTVAQSPRPLFKYGHTVIPSVTRGSLFDMLDCHNSVLDNIYQVPVA